MHLSLLDWAVIAVYLVITLSISLYFSKKAGKSLGDFFLGGRNLPWYVAGISMVATTFAADTPLAVTELVSTQGISGNWLWWNMLAGGMLTTFFFARLWRRANILTEIEFIELRYGGKAAAFLRGFKSVYLGLIMNVMVIGWVNLAMMTILEVFFGLSSQDALFYTAILMAVVAIYSSISGLLGVVFSDMVQFFIAMGACIYLAVEVVSLDQIGGISGLKAQLPEGTLDFFPKLGSASDVGKTLTISLGAFLAYTTVQWWSSWYPGAEPGGGGYIAQRMMSAKNEKHSIYATLFFQIAHYCLRPWPWIIVALCTLILYPDLGAGEEKFGFVMAMKDFLPSGLKGLLLVAFFSAYMSTISTQLNWGAGYLVNDLYKRFISPKASEKKLVTVSRITTIILMVVGLAVSSQINSISGVWAFIIECGAGLGLVLILRWYWWRINVWSEITATVVPFIVYGLGKWVFGLVFPESFFLTVGITTVSWIAITFLTTPEKDSVLHNFYQRVRPGGWWKEFNDGSSEDGKLGPLFVCWLSAIGFTYSFLFFMGKFIFQEYTTAIFWLIFGLGCFLILRIAAKKAKIFRD
ncbi:MAG: SSS family solute:Na+ symporter [Sphingobacteriales bacterium]|jgi:SSS family solute:Na+ symporter